MNTAKSVSVSALACLTLLSGCGTPPQELAMPVEMTCIYLKEPMSQIGKYGPLSVAAEIRLERGPYLSEKEDDKGTYYRAPPGGVSRGSVGFDLSKPNTGDNYGVTRDGGFYIPKNPNEVPKIYEYFSVANAPAEVPPADMNCSNFGYIRDPSTSKLSVISVAAGGAVGGAAGGVVGRSIAGHGMSYGHAAGVGAAGGLIGGLIVAGIVNANVGRIVDGLTIQDPEFIEKLRGLAASKVPVKELPPETGSQ